MAKRHLPSIEALTSSDEERLMTELRLSEVRDQVTHAKELLDAVDLLSAASDDGHSSDIGQGVAPSVAEELARLGCRIVEIASALSRTTQAVAPRSCEQLRAVT
jgi:hypothetical protein